MKFLQFLETVSSSSFLKVQVICFKQIDFVKQF